MNELQGAVAVLEEHIVDIHTVPEWADKLGFESAKYFSRKIRDAFGRRPKEIIVEKKLARIRECLRKSEGEIYYCIAVDLGFKNDTSLYKFIKRHTGMSVTELKRSVEKECRKGV